MRWPRKSLDCLAFLAMTDCTFLGHCWRVEDREDCIRAHTAEYGCWQVELNVSRRAGTGWHVLCWRQRDGLDCRPCFDHVTPPGPSEGTETGFFCQRSSWVCVVQEPQTRGVSNMLNNEHSLRRPPKGVSRALETPAKGNEGNLA